MYARITKFQSDPAKLEEMVSRIPAIREQIAAIDGEANWAMWNEDGTGMAMAIYEDEAAANAAMEQIQQVWGGLADLLTAPPEVLSFSNATKMRG